MNWWQPQLLNSLLYFIAQFVWKDNRKAKNYIYEVRFLSTLMLRPLDHE